jgi:hypothetical protein
MANYTIVSGDTPSSLANRFTGTPSRWPEICAANPQLKKHPTYGCVWYTGNVVQLPSSWVATPTVDQTAKDVSTVIQQVQQLWSQDGGQVTVASPGAPATTVSYAPTVNNVPVNIPGAAAPTPGSPAAALSLLSSLTTQTVAGVPVVYLAGGAAAIAAAYYFMGHKKHKALTPNRRRTFKKAR